MKKLTVYIDIVLLENICMNYIILLGLGYIIKLKINYLRIFVSSLIGAIYAVLAYSRIFPLYTNFLVKIVLSICMVYIAYYPKKIKGLIKELIVFYLVSFALGGCAFALLYWIKPQEIFMENGVFIGTYPIKIVLMGGLLGIAITYISFKLVKNKMNKSELVYDIKIELEEKEITTKVLLDTGNMLKEPLSNIPVVLIEKDILIGLLPKELIYEQEQIIGGDLKKQDNIEYKYKTRLKIIPYTSVGKENGIILGIKVDKISILTDVNEIVKKEVIVGIYNKRFSKSGKYFGLIGLDILERSDKNEYIANVKE